MKKVLFLVLALAGCEKPADDAWQGYIEGEFVLPDQVPGKGEGEWTEFSPHERMVHTETMKLGSGETILTLVETHEFTETGGATLMRITQAYQSKADRDGALASGMDEGMEACYRELDALVAR